MDFNTGMTTDMYINMSLVLSIDSDISQRQIFKNYIYEHQYRYKQKRYINTSKCKYEYG